jgi:pimeloyl-ACP methyl ester carboxylesterase
MALIKYRTADVDGFKVFYREAGPTDSPKLLLLHGFPSAGHMFRDLIPLLADSFYLARPGADEVQLDLFGDYKSNVALYPSFQGYFRTNKPPFLAAWGKNDPFFVPAGAEAFKRDNPRAVVRFFDTGHFALETHAREIAESIRDLLK